MKLQYTAAAAWLSILLALTACSDSDKPKPDPENPLLDSAKIDTAINEFLAADAVVGLSVATIKKSGDRTLIWSNSYGLRDRDSAAPVDTDTSFWAGSVSKAVMGATIMIANEKGFLQLDDDVHGIINSSAGFSLDNPGQQAVSIANLATHTSGIVDDDNSYDCAYFVPTEGGGHDKLANIFYDDMPCPEQSAVTLPGFLAAYLDADGEFYSEEDNFHRQTPGTLSEYSNIGAGLAGYLVELITGQDLATYAQQEIFTPLGMSKTSWRADGLERTNIATPYVVIDEELTALPVYELATWPDGGLRTNAADLAKLLSIILNNGVQVTTGERLLTETSLDRMLPEPEEDIGLFWEQEETTRINDEERSLVGHTGSDPGAFSLMLYDPISETGIVVIGNGDDDEIEETAFETLIEALFESASKLN